MHENAHLGFWFWFDEAEGKALMADGQGVVWLERSDFFNRQDKGGGDGSGAVGVLDDYEGELFGGMMDKPEEAVRPR